MPARYSRPRSITSILRRFQTLHPIQTARPTDRPPAAANRGQTIGTRFWKNVGIVDHDASFLVTLDTKPLKTPGGKDLSIPKSKRLVASLIAHEWECQENAIKAHALIMTSIAARAIDDLTRSSVRAQVQNSLLNYLDTDTIRFFEDNPEQLVQLQEQHWTPLLIWTKDQFDVDVEKVGSLIHHAPLPNGRTVFARVLNELDEWQLASFERAVITSKSFIIALALLKGRLNVDEAAHAAQVEVTSQIRRWGVVEETHDVDFHDVRRQFASAASLLVDS